MKATTRTVLALCTALCLTSAGRAQDAATPPEGTAPKQTGDGSHLVREGDTLWDLSGQYMGSTYEWPRLWSYNPEVTNPHWIYPGHVLRLREGAAGGYSTAPEGSTGTMTAQSGRLGSGFGQALGPSTRGREGTVVIGEEVYLDKDALEQAALIIGSPEEQMFLSPSDQVYLQFKKGAAPAKGKELSVFIRLHRKEVAPNAGKVRVYSPGEKGEVVRVLGALRIDDFDDKRRIARATILAARDAIERGFEVTDVPSRLASVPPKTNERKVEAQVVASNHPIGLLAQGQIVFINAGSEKGVQVGNRFAVVRQGDEWRQHLTLREDLTGAARPDPSPVKDKDLPWEVVAEARVLYVRSQTCTAVVTGSLSEVEPGDRVEMREGY